MKGLKTTIIGLCGAMILASNLHVSVLASEKEVIDISESKEDDFFDDSEDSNRETITTGSEDSEIPDGIGITSEDFIIDEYTVKGLTDIGRNKDDIVIPDGIQEIASSAFKNEKFRSVIIPESVVKIDQYSFSGCSNLSYVDIRSKSLEDSYGFYGDGVFKGCKISELKLSNEIRYLPAHLFEAAGFVDLDLTLPESVKEIGEECFAYCTGLNSIQFQGEKLERIGSKAFFNCTRIERITIPSSVTKICQYAFSGCSSLSYVDIRSKSLEDSYGFYGDGVFKGCKISELKLSNEIRYLPAHLFEAAGFVDLDLTFPESVKEIGEECFAYCTGLNSIQFQGEKLERIGNSAFFNCTEIESLTLPASVIKIGGRAFWGCTSLKGVLRIPASVTSVGDTYNHSFSNCKFECIVNNSATVILLPLRDHQTWLDYRTREEITRIANGIAILEGSTIDPSEFDPSLTYTVTYNANGGIGSLPVDNTEYSKGQTAVVKAPGNLKKPESRFKCWSITQDGSGPLYYEGTTIPVNNNIVLYAIWEDLYIDYWGFSNSSNNFGLSSNGYAISNSDYDRLISCLPKTLADRMNKYLNPNLSKKNGSWGGSCYGMSATTALVKNGRNKVSDFTHRSSDTILNGVLTADESFANGTDTVGSTESSINFYQWQQLLPEYDNFEWEYMKKSSKDQIDGVAQLAKETQQDRIPIQICFCWRSNGRILGHAIIGRGYRDLEPNEELYAQYPHCILTYDCSMPETIGDDSGNNIYFNDNGDWFIPNWGITNPGNVYFIAGTRDIDLVAPIDYLTGTYKKKEQTPSQILYDSNSGFSVIVGNDSVKIQGSYITENTGNLEVDILPECIESDSTTQSRYKAYLPNVSEYTVKADKLEHELLTDKCLVKASAPSGGTAVLSTTGEASIESENSGKLTLEVIDNYGKSGLSQEFELDVLDAKQLKEKKVDNGIIVESDNLNSLKIVSGDDSISVNTTETIENNVLVKEDNGEIGVFEDKNGDGEYDDKVRTKDDTKRENTIVVGQKINLREACFADVTDTISRFSVSNTSLAGISKDMLNGKKPGTVTVYAQKMISKNNYENLAECEVTMLSKPQLKFTKNMTYVGQSINGNDFFKTEDIKSYGATYWESNKPGIIEVTDSSKGTLQARWSGTAKITAYFGEKGVPGTYRVSANLVVKVPEFAKTDYSLQTGQKLTISMKNVTGALDPEWTTEKDTLAKASAQLNNKGVKTGKVIVEGLNYGDTKLVATINGQTYECTVHVTAPEINKQSMTLRVGKSGTVALKKTKMKKTDVVWDSTDKSIATVDANGKITTLSTGEAIIYTETGGIKNECHVTVNP